MEARIAELAALAVVALCVWQGAVRGLVLKVYSLVKVILLLVVTMVALPFLLPLFPSGTPGCEGIAFVAAMAVTAVVLHVLESLLKLVDRIPVVGTVNRIGGAGLGFVTGVLAVWVLLLLIGAMQEMEWCRRISEYVRHSEILMQVQQFNPLPFILKNFDFPSL